MAKGICSVEGCERPIHAKGHCGMHRARLVRTGTTDAPVAVVRKSCTITGCEKRASSRDYCAMHYSRWKRHGRADYNVERTRAVCTVDGCHRVVNGFGYCMKHYYRWRQHGDPLMIHVHIEQGCSVEGCENDFYGRDFCSLHWKRWRKHGDPLHDEPRPLRVGVEECEVDGCQSVMKANDVCAMHLHRLYRHGSSTARVRGEVVDGKRICSRCGVDHLVENFRGAWCRKCANDYIRPFNQRRRALAAGVDVTDRFTNAQVFERDEWTCGICENRIPRTRSWPDRLSASLDHVIPISLGGDHSYKNVQASHLGCNMAKGGRNRSISA